MAPTTPTVLLWVFPLLVALEAALLLAWTALFFVALKKEDERLTLDITTSAAHFVVLISLIELHARLTEACRKGVCTVKPTVSWLMPALVSLFFDIFGVARAITFYADHADYQVSVYAVFVVTNSPP
jgi:hypothetical protein